MAAISTLADGFATKDTTKWTWGSTAAVSSGRLSLPTNSAYSAFITSTAGYDLTSSSIFVQTVQRPNVGNGSTQLYFQLDINGTLNTNSVQFVVEGTFLRALRFVAGTQTQVLQGTYSATSHAWLRLRHSAGTVFWDTSPDGTTWTNFTSWAVTFAVTNLQASIGTGYYGTEPSPGTALVDNVNTAPGPARSGTGTTITIALSAGAGTGRRRSTGPGAALTVALTAGPGTGSKSIPSESGTGSGTAITVALTAGPGVGVPTVAVNRVGTATVCPLPLTAGPGGGGVLALFCRRCGSGWPGAA
jgi:hypothetical protein